MLALSLPASGGTYSFTSVTAANWKTLMNTLNWHRPTTTSRINAYTSDLRFGGKLFNAHYAKDYSSSSYKIYNLLDDGERSLTTMQILISSSDVEIIGMYGGYHWYIINTTPKGF